MAKKLLNSITNYGLDKITECRLKSEDRDDYIHVQCLQNALRDLEQIQFNEKSFVKEHKNRKYDY